MDAKEFYTRQETTAQETCEQLEKEHAVRAKSARKPTAHKFRVGDPVWVLRPQPMGTHRTKTWSTPEEVVGRSFEVTYCIKVGPGQFREQHESQLRARETDICGKPVSLGNTAHEARLDDDDAEQDDYTVEKILALRPNAPAPGESELKMRWRTHGPSDDTWEPVFSSALRIETPFMGYVRKHKTMLQVSDLEGLTLAIEAMGDRSLPSALS